MIVLSVNAGSSSLKFTAYKMPEEEVLISGTFERIGIDGGFYTIKINGEKIKKEKDLPNHEVAVNTLLDELLLNKVIKSFDEIEAIGHRVVHGGEKYTKSVIVDDEVKKAIRDLSDLAPLHNPANLMGIETFCKLLPNAKNVAVFDTAYHQTMPPSSYIYPVPYEWYTKYGVRKYGFHGTSHKYITGEMKKRLGKENVNLIICHVGSGASIACVKDGKCYDTTMGLTPLDGLMMGTRSGAIDPSILKYVMQESGETIDEITDDLNKKSGFYGVCGAADCRDVEHLAEEGNENAILALNMYANRIAKYIMDYYLELEGKVDTIVFTAGVLENGSTMRKMVMDRLKVLGITLDEELNNKIAGFKELHEGIISDGDSKIAVMVLPTNEEIMIVKDTFNKVIG